MVFQGSKVRNKKDHIPHSVYSMIQWYGTSLTVSGTTQELSWKMEVSERCRYHQSEYIFFFSFSSPLSCFPYSYLINTFCIIESLSLLRLVAID
ncbi:hypothetical protein GDO81_005624 [Engystomops pustulosus]|uniref:Uncharacterized protein n=1 Tax=Engystomops pustulosus TaxID=76066 RepID=A0AAV7CRE6_ENGPU|nr:hypothetical protein GDO81_005624 [Engystomops pustulosus]